MEDIIQRFEEDKPDGSWLDISKDGIRLDMAIKRVYRRMVRTKSDDLFVKLGTVLGNLTSKKLEITELVNEVQKIIR